MSRIVAPILTVLLAASSAASQNTPQTQQLGKEQQTQLTEASRLNESVLSLYKAGKYDEAFPIAERVVKIREQLLGKEDDKVIAAVFNLAAIQLKRGHYPEARTLFERVMVNYERTLGAEHVALGDVLEELAIVYYRLGQPSDTERAYQRSLTIREKALGSDHLEVMQSIRNLAEFYQFQGDYKKAEPLYQRLLELRKKQGSAVQIADALERYACLLRKTKRQPEAEELENQALRETDTRDPSAKPVSGGVLNGKAISLYPPAYPAEARDRRVSGRVTVRITIDGSGRVIQACAIEGPRLLMKASESAAYRSRFTPTSLDGQAVKVSGTIIYNFVAQ